MFNLWSIVLHSAYTEDDEELIETFNVKNHLNADDTQVLANARICKVQCYKSNIESCVLGIQDRCYEKRLQLNPNKTDVIWLGSRANLTKMDVADLDNEHKPTMYDYI